MGGSGHGVSWAEVCAGTHVCSRWFSLPLQNSSMWLILGKRFFSCLVQCPNEGWHPSSLVLPCPSDSGQGCCTRGRGSIPSHSKATVPTTRCPLAQVLACGSIRWTFLNQPTLGVTVPQQRRAYAEGTARRAHACSSTHPHPTQAPVRPPGKSSDVPRV